MTTVQCRTEQQYSKLSIGMGYDPACNGERKKVAAELELHSDLGVQYTSQGNGASAQSHRIPLSMSGKDNCYGNTMAEESFSILKTD